MSLNFNEAVFSCYRYCATPYSWSGVLEEVALIVLQVVFPNVTEVAILNYTLANWPYLDAALLESPFEFSVFPQNLYFPLDCFLQIGPSLIFGISLSGCTQFKALGHVLIFFKLDNTRQDGNGART